MSFPISGEEEEEEEGGRIDGAEGMRNEDRREGEARGKEREEFEDFYC